MFFNDATLPITVGPGAPSDLAQFFPKQHSTWTPKAGQSADLDYYITKCKKEIAALDLAPLHQSNISPSEQQALSELKQRTDIDIKRANKGGVVVVWQKDLYEQGAAEQLADANFYSPIQSSQVKKDNTLVRKTIKEAIASGYLPCEATAAITKEPREGRFYLLPKIHKPGNPGRPIVSACSCPTTQISEFLDKIFQPLVQELPTYIKDTNHALQLFNDFTFPLMLQIAYCLQWMSPPCTPAFHTKKDCLPSNITCRKAP